MIKQRNRDKEPGTIFQDYQGHWWILEKDCESYISVLSYDKKADGSVVRIDYDPESFDRLKEVTTAMKVLYGKKETRNVR